MKNLLGIASGFFAEPAKEKWQSAVKAGLTEAELGLHEFSRDDMLERAGGKYKLLAESGVSVSSCHLPFGGFWDISSLDETQCSDAVNQVKNILDWIKSKNIGIAIIHPSAEPIENNERAKRLEKSIKNIKELGEYAKERNIILAVENLPRTCLGNCADEMLVLTDSGKNTSICFDVNHLLIETHKEFYEKIAPYVVTTHLSDYDRINERHWLPGDGCIDWAELAGLFEKHDYAGRYIFEINENASPSLNRACTPVELVDRFRQVCKREHEY
jgi:sugar phosphate isomerase/epimerase